MRVQATKQGFYNQYLHEIGEVFDLLNEPDGTMPLRMIQHPVLDKDGKPTGEYTEEVWLDEDGNPMHRDFSPHNLEIKGRGQFFKGETFRDGWMREVPADTALGIYPYDIMQASRDAPVQRVVRPSTEPLNAPRATEIRGVVDRRPRT